MFNIYKGLNIIYFLCLLRALSDKFYSSYRYGKHVTQNTFIVLNCQTSPKRDYKTDVIDNFLYFSFNEL